MTEQRKLFPSGSDLRRVTVQTAFRSGLVAFCLLYVQSTLVQAQVLQARVSVKRILDENGNRSSGGRWDQDAQIEAAVRVANEILETNGAEWRFDLDEIVEVEGLSEWYSLDGCLTAARGIEARALSDPQLYRWRHDAINIYLGVYTCAWGSEPSRDSPPHEIVLFGDCGRVPPEVCAPFVDPELRDFANGQGWLHEVGHYFDLCHTHGCEYGGGACPDARAPGDDQVDDTLPDLDCWERDDIARWSFALDYAELGAEEQQLVDQTAFNTMSYHGSPGHEATRSILTQSQLARMAAEMDPFTGRRTHVLNLPRPAFAVTPENPGDLEELRVDGAPSTTENGHAIVRFEWDFGDGTIAEDVSVTHTYAEPGLYTIRLVVTDDRGFQNVVDKSVAVVFRSEDISPWTAVDLGEPDVPGGARFEDDCFLIFGAEGNIQGRSDAFHFAQQSVSGNFSLKARIADWTVEGATSKLGLTVRESLESGARHGTVVLEKTTDGFQHQFLRRTRTRFGTRAVVNTTYEEAGVWLRVERRGNVLSGSLSTDGVTWLEPDTVELPELPETVYAGVASSWVVPAEGGATSPATLCDMTLETAPPVAFLRGDCDGDGNACSGVNDALTLLSWLFRDDTKPPCVAACDSDGNGEAELTDAVYGLDYCFTGTAPPPTPFPDCGPGTEADAMLGCEMSACK